MAEKNEPPIGAEQQGQPIIPAQAQVKPAARPATGAKAPSDERDEFIRNALPVAAALRQAGNPEEAKKLELVANALLQTKSMERAPATEQVQGPAKEESVKDLLASVYNAIDQNPALKNMPEARDMRRAGNKLDKDGMLNITVRNGVVTSFVSNFTDNFSRTQQASPEPALSRAAVGAAAPSVKAPTAQQLPPAAPAQVAQQVPAVAQAAPAPAPSRTEIIYAAAPPDSSGSLGQRVLSSQAAHNSVFQIQVDPWDANKAILLPAPGADTRLVSSLQDSMDNAYTLRSLPEPGKSFLAVETPTQLVRTAEGWRVTEKGFVGFSAAASVYQAQQPAPLQQPAQQPAQGLAGTARVLENARRAVTAATAPTTPFTRADISAEELAKVGVQVADLEKTGQLQKLLEGKKTDLLPFVLPTSDGVAVPFEAKLVLHRDAQGVASLRVDLPKHELEIPRQIMGKDITPAMQVQLQANGVVPLAEGFKDGQGQPFAAYLAVDREMKRVVAVRPEGIALLKEVHGVRLSTEQSKQLLEGRPTRIQGMTNTKQQLVDATVQLDPLARKLIFRDTQPRVAQKQTKNQDQEPARRRGVRV